MIKTTIFPACILAGIFLSCNSKPSNTGNDSTALQSELGNSNASCYMKAAGKDTFLLQVLVDGQDVNGVLDYNFFEKDQNSGIIDGAVKDNIVRATYSFTSEGTKSTREVVFKLMGEEVYEGLPERMDSTGNPVFNANDALLKFDPSPYKKQACQ